MKRTISALVAIFLLLSFAPTRAKAAEEGALNESIRWSLDDSGTLTITGTGPMPDYVLYYTYDGRSLSWSFQSGWAYMPYADQITSVVIGEGITSVGQGCFLYMDDLQTVLLPDTVRVISPMAFYGCTHLAEINVPAALEEVGELAFEKCSSIPTFILPAKERDLLPAVSRNAYANRSKTVCSYLYLDGEDFVRVENINGQIVVERYDRDFRLLSAFNLESDLYYVWGGFFAGETYNFIITGRANPDERSDAEVIRIWKYSKEWTRLDELSLYGQNTKDPFGGGSLRCAELDGVLWIHTCHRMFKASDGLNHQANMTFSVRESDMTLLSAQTGVSNIGTGYVSHSFTQYILADREGRLVCFDHGDAYPRSAVLIRKNGSSRADYVDIQTFPGAIGDNTTGASLGGLAETDAGYLTAYNYNGVGASSEGSVMGVATEDPMPTRNVYLGYTAKADFSENGTTVRKITDYADNGPFSAGNPVLVATGANEGYLIWDVLSLGEAGTYQSTGTLAYVRYGIDGSVSEIHTMNGKLSDCQPIAVDGKAIWYVTDNSEPGFYVLDDDGLNVSYGEEKPISADTGLWKELMISNEYFSEKMLEKMFAILPDEVTVITNYGREMKLKVYGWTTDTEACRWVAEVRPEDLPEGMEDPNGVLDRIYLPYVLKDKWCYFDVERTPALGDPGVFYVYSLGFEDMYAEFYHITERGESYEAIRMPAQEGHSTDSRGRIIYEPGTTLHYNISAWQRSDAGDWMCLLYEPDGTAMLCGMLSVSFPEDDPGPDDPGPDDPGPDDPEPFRFDDVRDSGKFYYQPVYWAYGHRPQITNGLTKTVFGPDAGCTRGQVVTFLWRAAGCPEPEKIDTGFKDLKEDGFYVKAVAWAVEQGITNGMSADRFGPDATCTRGQIVTFLWRFKGKPEPVNRAAPFKDLKKDGFYLDAVAWAVENNITNGMSANQFAPDNTCTRGQVVTFLYRAAAA